MIVSAPKHFSKLQLSDQKEYYRLQELFSTKLFRCNRNQRLEKFNEMISIIKKFCIKNNENDLYRCLVCGIFWFSNSYYISINQFKKLTRKTVSSINSSFKLLGYQRIGLEELKSVISDDLEILLSNIDSNAEKTKSDSIITIRDLIIKNIPYFKDHLFEMKGWSLRGRPSKKKQEVINNLNEDKNASNIFDFNNEDFPNDYHIHFSDSEFEYDYLNPN